LKYHEVTEETGQTVNYLGMTISTNQSGDKVFLQQPNFIDQVLKEYNITGTAPSPATHSLFQNNDNEEMTEKKTFASMVMKLMYLAKRTRPDILCAATFLSTRIHTCTHDDFKKVMRVYKYLNGTKAYGLNISPTSLELEADVDASYAVHSDAKGHGGAIIRIGRHGIVSGKSWKLKLVARSSTEAELIALHDATAKILWLRKLCEELGISTSQPTIINQDNLSTMKIIMKGKLSGKTKHMDVRYFFVKEKIDEGKIQLRYKPTSDMSADHFTKPITGSQHYRLIQMMGVGPKHW